MTRIQTEMFDCFSAQICAADYGLNSRSQRLVFMAFNQLLNNANTCIWHEWRPAKRLIYRPANSNIRCYLAFCPCRGGYFISLEQRSAANVIQALVIQFLELLKIRQKFHLPAKRLGHIFFENILALCRQIR